MKVSIINGLYALNISKCQLTNVTANISILIKIYMAFDNIVALMALFVTRRVFVLIEVKYLKFTCCNRRVNR